MGTFDSGKKTRSKSKVGMMRKGKRNGKEVTTGGRGPVYIKTVISGCRLQ
jgi:hypothetical protein